MLFVLIHPKDTFCLSAKQINYEIKHSDYQIVTTFSIDRGKSIYDTCIITYLQVNTTKLNEKRK